MHTIRIGTSLRPVTDGKSSAESLQVQQPPSLQTYQTEQSDHLSSCAVDTDAVSISHETTQSLVLVVSVSLCSPNGSQGIAMPRKKVVFQYRCDEVSCYLKIRSAKWNSYCLKKKHMYKFKRCFPNFSIKCVNSSSVLQNKTTFISSGSQGLD